MLVIEKAGKGTKNFVYIQIFKRKSEKFMYFVHYMTHLLAFLHIFSFTDKHAIM